MVLKTFLCLCFLGVNQLASGQTLAKIFEDAFGYFNIVSQAEEILEKENYERLLRELGYTNYYLLDLSRKKQDLLLELKNSEKGDTSRLTVAAHEMGLSLQRVRSSIQIIDGILINQPGGVELVVKLDEMAYSKRENVVKALEKWYLNGDTVDIPAITLETEVLISEIQTLMKTVTNFRFMLITEPEKYIK